MNQQTPEEGWQELQAHIERFFDHVLRKEKENANLSRLASRPETKNYQSDIPSQNRQSHGK
jgi:hypothetical protein